MPSIDYHGTKHSYTYDTSQYTHGARWHLTFNPAASSIFFDVGLGLLKGPRQKTTVGNVQIFLKEIEDVLWRDFDRQTTRTLLFPAHTFPILNNSLTSASARWFIVGSGIEIPRDL